MFGTAPKPRSPEATELMHKLLSMPADERIGLLLDFTRVALQWAVMTNQLPQVVGHSLEAWGVYLFFINDDGVRAVSTVRQDNNELVANYVIGRVSDAVEAVMDGPTGAMEEARSMARSAVVPEERLS